MNDNKYWIIIKTGEAEIRALENVPKDILSKTIPLIEITFRQYYSILMMKILKIILLVKLIV